MTVMAQQLGLSRSTLLSLITILGTTTLFLTGATFAVSTSDSASGSVKAGSFIAIDVRGSGGGGALVFSFTGSDPTCPSGLTPGDVCRAEVTVENTGFSSLTLDAPTTPTGFASVVESELPNGACANTFWPVTLGALGTSTLDPGDTTTFLVTVTLSASAPLDCQNETATVTVEVSANT